MDLRKVFNKLVDHLRKTNPLVQEFKTMTEINFGIGIEKHVPAAPIVAAGNLKPTIAATLVWREPALHVCSSTQVPAPTHFRCPAARSPILPVL